MTFEIDKAFEAFQRSKSRQFSEYTSRAYTPILDSLIGYIADVDDLSRLRNEYNVIVPAMANTMLRRVPRSIPGAAAQANGTGFLPQALRPGQTVIIKFLNNRTSLPYIDSALFMNGQLDLWSDGKVPQMDEKDLTDLALLPSPLPPEAQAVKGDAEVKVYPLVLRVSSPTQPSNSATALEVPGTTYVTDSSGNVFSYFAGERIVVGKNEQKQQAGARQSMADMPKDEALKQAIRRQAKVLESLANWRAAVGGEYTVQTPHPAAKRRRAGSSESSGSLTISENGISGQFETLIGGTEFLGQAFNEIEGITQLLDQALSIGDGQLDFLQKTLMPLISKLKSLWGSFGGFGLKVLSFQLDLPFNLKLSISVKFDVKTGKLSINANLGFGSGTPIVGSQPLPLRAESGLIAGGYPRSLNTQVVVRTTVTDYYTSTIYTDFPELAGYQPEQLISSNVPYEHVSSDLSNLNFTANPGDAVASILTQYGVSAAYAVTRYLLPLVKYGSVFDFLKIAAVLANPIQTVVITTGVTIIGGFEPIDENRPNVLHPEITEVLQTITKPAIVTCPTLPDEVYRIVYLAQRGEITGATNVALSYFQIQLPNYIAWVEDLDNFMDWAEANHHPYYPALYQLHQGSVLNFLVLALYLKTGVDLRLFPRAYEEFSAYVDVAYPEVLSGAVLDDVEVS